MLGVRYVDRTAALFGERRQCSMGLDVDAAFILRVPGNSKRSSTVGWGEGCCHERCREESKQTRRSKVRLRMGTLVLQRTRREERQHQQELRMGVSSCNAANTTGKERVRELSPHHP